MSCNRSCKIAIPTLVRQHLDLEKWKAWCEGVRVLSKIGIPTFSEEPAEPPTPGPQKVENMV